MTRALTGPALLVAVAVAVAQGAAQIAAQRVHRLKDSNFEEQVKLAEGPWVVDFQNMPQATRADELAELADYLHGTGVQVGVVDQSTEHVCGAGKAGLRFYGIDKTDPPKTLVSAKGQLDASDAAVAVLDEIRRAVLARVPSSTSSSSSSSSSSGHSSSSTRADSTQQKRQKKAKEGQGARPGADGRVLELSDKTFDETVQQSDDAFLVSFTAPWCGHCQRLHPEWAQAASELAGSGVVIANVDATANEALAQRFGIQGFPTIKFFPPGAMNKDDDAAEDYQMERSAEAIVAWSLEAFERHGGQVSLEIPELVSQADFEDTCGAQSKCVIAFLPHILDSGKQGREELIAELEDAQRKARHMPFAWVEAGAQPAWEEAYSLEFGFPAVLLLRRHGAQELALPMRGSGFTGGALSAFAASAKTLGEFFDGGWPRIQTVEPWDGEEGQPPEVADDDDDFDLDAFLAED
ncbi:Protein disulfide-isomerase A6 [Hondaea fermentalgiana]|uniref:Protein disulfide-isomerase A6 n=1 Tax=Hondaea fermentalgiana TaxID=2315210 RepID=A0A2R5G1Y3_9STRA|nr:Protein disulfide-isomerase A6 [Hondaea fermentalgiana]|eukprot:GBG25026.1 Protein disulfide-isomerase A6 [Hondaea fermentalgiana]